MTDKEDMEAANAADNATRARLGRTPRYLSLIDMAIKAAAFRVAMGYWGDSREVRAWES